MDQEANYAGAKGVQSKRKRVGNHCLGVHQKGERTFKMAAFVWVSVLCFVCHDSVSVSVFLEYFSGICDVCDTVAVAEVHPHL